MDDKHLVTFRHFEPLASWWFFAGAALGMVAIGVALWVWLHRAR